MIGPAPWEVGRFQAVGTVSVNGYQNRQLANPSAPTLSNSGTAGSTTYRYAIVCHTVNSGGGGDFYSTVSGTGSTSTATLRLVHLTTTSSPILARRGTCLQTFSNTFPGHGRRSIKATTTLPLGPTMTPGRQSVRIPSPPEIRAATAIRMASNRRADSLPQGTLPMLEAARSATER